MAAADVDVAAHGLGVLRVGVFVEVHHVHRRAGHVIDVEEFALGGARAPDRDAGGVADLGFVESSDERGDDVAVFRVIVVAGAVEVGGHDAAVVDAVCGAVLAVIAFTELDAGDFGDGIGLVGGLQGAGEQGVFAHGLAGVFGVDAAGAEEEELFRAMCEGGVDDVGLDHQIFVDKLRRVGVVGMDAADSGRGEIDLVGLFFFEEFLDSGLVGEIELAVGACDEVECLAGLLGLLFEHPEDGRAHHAPVTSDV